MARVLKHKSYIRPYISPEKRDPNRDVTDNKKLMNSYILTCNWAISIQSGSVACISAAALKSFSYTFLGGDGLVGFACPVVA